jgi:2,3-diketo-5-methylthiopentyl-1-phosphate enolase
MYIEVDYLFPVGSEAQKQAEMIALGQTAGTWSAKYDHKEDSFRQHLAEVLELQQLENGSTVARIQFPLGNVENDIPSLLTMIFGKYSMAGTAKVISLNLPDEYGLKPKFGITGIRQILNIWDRPLVMSIFKPALGLSALEHAAILEEVAESGLDIIKDEELLGDLPSVPTLERLQACREVLESHQARTGRTMLYAVNVTGRADFLLEKARLLVRNGANALLLNVLSYGFAVLEALVADPEVQVPIFVHPALAGALCGSPDFGLSYEVVLGSLVGHAGADAVLYPASYGNLQLKAEEEQKISQILRSRNIFPVPSAGLKPAIVPQAIKDHGIDIILNAGTGIMDHPAGPSGGVKDFLQAVKHSLSS